jgi:gentisate 1,2-dioxygenase
MTDTTYLARYQTAQHIRLHGAIGNLNEGPEIVTHGVPTRLIAWPGNGFQTESVHVLTLASGLECQAYSYGLAEEALLCVQGQGQVYLRERWVDVEAGDLAYFPAGVAHAVRNPGKEQRDCVLVSQITPPQIDLYAPHFYDRKWGVMNFEGARKAAVNAPRGNLSADCEMQYHGGHPQVRAWNLSAAEVRQAGALFNIYVGTPFSGIGLPTRLVLWPGAGSRTAGFNYAFAPAGVADLIHTHPVSDECLVLWAGRGQVTFGNGWIDVGPHDCVLAPCGVMHGHRNGKGPGFWGGFASPPQLDLLMETEHYKDGEFRQAPCKAFTPSECPGAETVVPPFDPWMTQF